MAKEKTTKIEKLGTVISWTAILGLPALLAIWWYLQKKYNKEHPNG